ncbi:hypothetical protein L1S45_01845 [Aeromonas dhakensis]|uniref:hypothetical protein n=1 Tax=Aeromonas dhakensis TaxID=196024 RepID=UPI00208F0279|nr:hypothetical protein [Aeromonas dhakensis]USP10392.1 hypothetical protein L1S45_01845 [Aeromonas dhakensis]
MEKEITLTYYKILKMGIYERNGTCISTPSQLLKELKEWSYDNHRPLVETSTFEPNKLYLEAFCLDFYEENGNYILALWNKLPSHKKGIGSVPSDATPETAIIAHTSIDKNHIPGFPTYFYISPASEYIATIKIENNVLGLGQLRSYVKGYLKTYCSHIVNRQDGNDKVFGLCRHKKPLGQPDNRVPEKSLLSYFMLSAARKEMGREFIINNAHNISKVVKDISRNILNKDNDETAIERIVRCFKGLPMTAKRSTRVTMPVDLAQEHVKRLIEDYYENDCSEEYNVGFIIRGDAQKIHWLDGTVHTESTKGDLKMHTFDQPDLQSLMSLIKTIGDVEIESAGKKNVA